MPASSLKGDNTWIHKSFTLLAVRFGVNCAGRIRPNRLPVCLSGYNPHMGKRSTNAEPTTDRASGETLAVWEFAGLMLTYWCNARCAFCYVCSGPDRDGEMSVDDAIGHWSSLDRLAAAHGRSMRIHLAGGEPFHDWVQLVSILRAARDARLSPVEKVETNAFWAADDGLTRSRLELLDALGLGTLVISWDPYHAAYVPVDRVRRCVEIARRVLGRGRVRVRWWEFLHDPVDVRRLDAKQREDVFREALQRHKDRLTGRAAIELAHLCERHSAATFAGQHCVDAILRSRHVHIDPYGNIFPGTCGGIILGQTGGGGLRTVEQVWQQFSSRWHENPVAQAVVAGGSYELLQRVRPLGYRELPGGYADKCHLCAHIRQFLVDCGIWPQAVGPPACYGNEADRAAAIPPQS